MTTLGQQVNLLWVVIGAVLVIFMQAGFALVETGFCRAKHAAHVVSTNFAIFGLGFVGYYLVGYGLMFGGYSVPLIGFNEAPGEAFIGSGEWIFLWKGGFALTDMVGPGGAGAAAARLLPLHGGLHGHRRHDPHRGHGRAVEVEQLRRVGPLLRRHLLPAVRRLDLGRRLAVAARQLDGPRLRLRRLRRLRRRAHRGWRRRRSPAPSCSAPASASSTGTARPTRSRATTSRWPCSACFILLFGWFGFNAASTFAATDVQFAIVATNTAIAGAFGAVAAMFIMQAKTGKPDPGMMVNGMLAGLVAITAPCAFVDPWAAAVIGVLAAVHRRSSRSASSSAAASTIRSVPSPCTASAAPSASSASASSPTAPTAPAGTSPPRATWPSPARA